MGSLNDKEKEFKSVLENLEFDINTDQLWEKVSPHLNEKKKDRPFFFYLLGLTLALVFGAGTVYLTMSNSSETFTNNNLTENHGNTNNINALNSTTSETITSNLPKANNEKATHDSQQDDNKNLNTKKSIKSEIATNKTSNYLPQNKIVDKANTFAKVNPSTTILKTEKQGTILKNSQKVEPNIIVNKLNGKSNKVDSSHILFNDVVASDTYYVKNNLELDNDLSSATLLIDIASLDKITPVALNNITERLGNFDFENDFGFIHVADRHDKNWRAVYAINFGFNKSASSSQLVLNNSEFDVNQFDKETGLFGFSSAFEFGFENRKGWSVFGVISHRTQNSVFRNTDIESETVSVTDQGSHINTDGFLETQGVELLETTTTINNINWNRRHSYVDLGIGVGKELIRFGNFNLGVRTSLQYNLASKHSGYYFDDESSDINKFTSDEDNAYKSNNGLSGLLDFKLEWRYKNIGIGVTPFLQYRMNSILDNSNFYKNKDNNYGLNLSVSYRPL